MRAMLVGLVMVAVISCATAGEPPSRPQSEATPTNPGSSAGVRMMSDEAVKKLFGFIEEAAKREDLSDIKWIEQKLGVRHDLSKKESGTYYSFSPVSIGGLARHVQLSVWNDDQGRLRRHDLNIGLADSIAHCVNVETVKTRFPDGRDEYRSLHFSGEREQPLWAILKTFSENRRILVSFDFYYRRCLPSLHIAVFPKTDLQGDGK